MQERFITVKAMWDEEAEVWTVVESDLPGLVAEADTSEALLEKLKTLVPELVALNGHLLDWKPEDELPICFMAQQLERIRLNS